MLRRVLLHLGTISTLVLGLGTTMGALHAAPPKRALTTYTNRDWHYRIAYPAGWKMLDAKAGNIDLASADRTAYLLVAVQWLPTTNTLTAGQLRHDLTGLLQKDLHIRAEQGQTYPRLQFAAQRTHGLIFQVGNVTGTTLKGNRVHLLLAEAFTYPYDYVVVGEVLLASPKGANAQAKPEIAAVRQSLKSFTFCGLDETRCP